ncbi:MAG: hypothetical protein J0I28_08755 [Caulobacterales bacterium]|nr:hypothetical protein [Caulobacterales bacterium]
MTTLYEMLLPHVQAINEEGGNWSSFLMSRPVLDAIEAGAVSDPDLALIRRKILEKLAAYKGVRHHAGFNQIFEAYSEGVIYLAARHRGVALTAISDGASKGKTPDFATKGAEPIGLEVKTINVLDPERTIDAAMEQGFEAGYAALEASRAEAAEKGVGVGFGIAEFAPHGDGANGKEAVEQTIKKIRSNVKAGQYAARPTFLVVSLARLGVRQHAAQLRRRLDIDEDCGVAPSGHLFAIAAAKLGDDYADYGHGWFGVRDTGPLTQAGILQDHDEIAGLVFLETEWSQTDKPDAIATGFRFNGVWNIGWNPAPFSAAEQAEARRVFEALCDTWTDTDDSRAHLIPGR